MDWWTCWNLHENQPKTKDLLLFRVSRQKLPNVDRGTVFFRLLFHFRPTELIIHTNINTLILQQYLVLEGFNTRYATGRQGWSIPGTWYVPGYMYKHTRYLNLIISYFWYVVSYFCCVLYSFCHPGTWRKVSTAHFMAGTAGVRTVGVLGVLDVFGWYDRRNNGCDTNTNIQKQHAYSYAELVARVYPWHCS